MTSGGVVGVILDLDGVVVDSEQLWERSWGFCCAQHSVPWLATDTSAVQGMSSFEWSEYVAAKLGDPELARLIRAECVGYVVGAIDSGQAPLVDGAEKLIREVSERVPVALASSAARAVIDAVLRRHSIDEWFSATVSSEEVRRGKPSPDVYLEAANRIGVAGTAGIAVEDSSNGIRSAHAAGLSVVAIPNPHYPPRPEALALADHVAADHRDALDHVLARLT